MEFDFEILAYLWRLSWKSVDCLRSKPGSFRTCCKKSLHNVSAMSPTRLTQVTQLRGDTRVLDGAQADLGRKSSLHLRDFVYSAKALRQCEAQSVQQYFLGVIRGGYATKPDRLQGAEIG